MTLSEVIDVTGQAGDFRVLIKRKPRYVDIAQRIDEYRLNRVVIAACTPRTHEPLFRDTLREAGLNPFLIEMANIRNQNAWVHRNAPEAATAKAKDQVAMAAARVRRNAPLERLTVNVVQKALVVGGGLSGMNAALSLANQGFETVLIEKSDLLGGNARRLNFTWRGEAVRPAVDDMIHRIEHHQNIRIMKQAVLKKVDGSVGNYTGVIDHNGQDETVTFGGAVIAVGGKELKPDEYGYGTDDRIMVQLEFDAAMRHEKFEISKAQHVVFIQCVGSREPARPYCSHFCCSHSVRSAVDLKTLNPQTDVTVLYRDIRTYGEREDLYRQARQMGVSFIRYTPEQKPRVTCENDHVIIGVRHRGLQRDLRLSADYLVLASAIIPNGDNKVVTLFKCPTDSMGFLSEAHPKLRPVDAPVDGLFVSGLCRYPKPVDECIIQAQAAAMRAGILLARKNLQLDATKSYVTEKCDGCALCLDVCPYHAIQLETVKNNGKVFKRISTDKALCKGCGLCEATCPKGGVSVSGFTHEQIHVQVDAILKATQRI